LIEDRGWTFAAVQERLVEAMITCWRQPDGERAWQRVVASDGPWRLVMAEAGDYDGGRGAGAARAEAAIRPASLTRRELAEMEEAFAWCDALRPEERRIVGLAIAALAGGRREVPWRALLRPMGLERGADGLRMRYGRAIARIAARLNGGNARGLAVNPD
jgi:hypothetical protein